MPALSCTTIFNQSKNEMCFHFSFSLQLSQRTTFLRSKRAAKICCFYLTLQIFWKKKFKVFFFPKQSADTAIINFIYFSTYTYTVCVYNLCTFTHHEPKHIYEQTDPILQSCRLVQGLAFSQEKRRIRQIHLRPGIAFVF